MAARERVLVTTLTKRMAEELTDYYAELGVKVRYLHSDVKTLERMDILRELREGVFDVLVGINLLREGLDLPEVSLVAVLDADKEGFLRSTRSLIQTIGRAARNVNGAVILYADRETDSIRETLAETEPAPRGADALEQRARHHAADRAEAHLEPARVDLGARLRDGAGGGRRASRPRSRGTSCRSCSTPCAARCATRRASSISSARPSCGTASGSSRPSSCRLG